MEQARDLLGDPLEHRARAAPRRRRAWRSGAARPARPPERGSRARWPRGAARPRGDWVTSLIVETTPSGRPPASRTGAELIQTQAGVPSGRVRRAVSGACGSPVTSASSPRSRPPETARSSASTAAPRTSSGRRPRSRSRIDAEDLLRGRVAVGDDPARVAHDEALGHRLHHRAQSLLVGAQRLVGAGALRRHGGEHERRQRRGGQEELGREQAVGDRLAHERPRVVRRVPDRERRDATTSAVAAPRGPKRSAAQISTGKTT